MIYWPWTKRPKMVPVAYIARGDKLFRLCRGTVSEFPTGVVETIELEVTDER